MRTSTRRVPTGRLLQWSHRSECLRGNPWRDPIDRQITVYLPPGYDDAGDVRYPLMMDLVGFTGSGFSHLNWQPFTESLPERLDRLIRERRMGPAIVVFPDCFTRLGGNQYVNSTGVGSYQDYLIDEVLPQVEARVRALPGRKHRAVFGKSSGGYGALMHAMLRADVWGAAACHSGDLYFDFCYRMDAPRVLNTLAAHGGDAARFVRAFWRKSKHSDADVHTLMFLAMAATYDPHPRDPRRIQLPFDSRTGLWDNRRWERWLHHDPIHRVDQAARQLKTLKLLYIDCGVKDQYHLHFGARILHDRLTAAHVPHVYREFSDDHSKIDYRMDVSLPLLWKAIR